MSMSVKDVLAQTDWELFRKQKAALRNLPTMYEDEQNAVSGILNFIDALQDAVVEDGIATEQQVFGE